MESKSVHLQEYERAQAKPNPGLKMTKEQGGHCGYFMDPVPVTDLSSSSSFVLS